MLIDPRHLMQLHTIIATGSFILAAEKLGLTQPGLSRNMRILEERIGVKLLNRGKQGASATDEGKRLAAFGRQLDEVTQLAASRSHALRSGEVGELRIGVSFSVSEWILSETIAGFVSNRPNIRIKVIPGNTRDMHRDLEAGLLDIVIGGKQFTPEIHGVQSELLLENQLIIIGRPNHPLSTGGVIDPILLRDMKWAICAETDPLRREIESAMTSLGIEDDNIAIESGNNALIVKLLNKTDYLAMVPSPFALSVMQDGLAEQIIVPRSLALRPLTISYRSNSQFSQAKSIFIKILKTHIESLSLQLSARL